VWRWIVVVVVVVVETWRRGGVARAKKFSRTKKVLETVITSKEKTNTWQLLLDHVAQQASHEGFPSWLFLPELRIKAHNKLYHKSVFPLLFFTPLGPKKTRVGKSCGAKHV
jgi:hypothetical protein